MFFSNIIGYDGIIIVLTIINIFIIVFPTRILSKKIESILKKVVYLPITALIGKIKKSEKDHLDLHELSLLHEKEERLHQVFVSITSILPLLGILGTVIALLSSSAADINVLKVNFTSALTSTFWGLAGAIICKVLEGVISPVIEQNGKSISLLLSRMDKAQE